MNDVDLLLRRLEKDSELQARWSRYHLVSDVLHKAAPPWVPLDLANRVAAAVDEEPYHLVPRRRRFTPPGRVRQVVGLAIAASVTAITILTVQSLTIPAMPSGLHLVSLGSHHSNSEPASRGERSPSREAKLTAYLVNHSEYLVASGMPGALPYVRLVGHSSE